MNAKQQARFEALENEVARLKAALKWIGTHKCCDEVRDLDKMARGWGLERGEFVEMAHDNLVVAARNALKRPKKPRAVAPPAALALAREEGVV